MFRKLSKLLTALAEAERFEPPVGLLLRLISSQVPSTTQPPFRATTALDALCGKRSAEQAHLRNHHDTGGIRNWSSSGRPHARRLPGLRPNRSPPFDRGQWKTEAPRHMHERAALWTC